MDLLDRYVKAVREFLPRTQRDDIARELSENIRSRMEDREAELGRPLDESEQAAILKEHGNPALVAGRYRQDHATLAFGRQWIGPVLFPLYAKILCLNLGISAFVCLGMIVFLDKTISEALRGILVNLLIQFGTITLIFAAAENHLTRFPNAWDPKHPLVPQAVVKDKGRISRGESLFQLVVLAVLLHWLWAFRRSPDLALDPAADALKLSPAWTRIYLPIVAATLLGMIQASVNLFRPGWTRFRSVARVVATGLWLASMISLLPAGDWVTLAGPGVDPAGEKRRFVEFLNHFLIFPCLIVIAAVCVGQILFDLRDLSRGRRRDAGQAEPLHHD